MLNSRDFTYLLKMATNIPKKKRPRWAPRYQMEVTFPNEVSKKRFLTRMDRVKSSISSSGSRRNADNYSFLSLLLDHFEDASCNSNVVPSTTSQAQKKPIQKHSGKYA